MIYIRETYERIIIYLAIVKFEKKHLLGWGKIAPLTIPLNLSDDLTEVNLRC